MINPFQMVDGEDWLTRALDYYFEFRWWKYAVVFIIGILAGHFGIYADNLMGL